MSNDGIVVGYDGSAGAETALRWALEEATRHETGCTSSISSNARGVRYRSRPCPVVWTRPTSAIMR